jgi:hypothetical protein
MRIRVISFGTNWWTVHSNNLDDPFCFRRRAAWFNSTGLRTGRRLRLCWVYPGQVRFNQNSGFDPEHPMRSVGRTFFSQGPTTMQGRTHLLLSHLVQNDATPDRYLVTLSAQHNGHISFASHHWMSEGAQPISVSLRRSSFEAMLLLGETDWIATDLGTWAVSRDGHSFTLQTLESETKS